MTENPLTNDRLTDDPLTPEQEKPDADKTDDVKPGSADASPRDQPDDEREVAGKDSEIDLALLKPRVEAILFATDAPVSPRRIAEVLGVGESAVRAVIGDIRAHCDEAGHAFNVEEIAGGFQLLTRPDFGEVVKLLFKVDRQHKLSQAALETLAIIAYKQPVMRVEVEDIRGVQVQPLIKSLMEQGLVRIVGRAETLGRPLLYGTTQKFLLHFGLKSAKDLPSVEDLKKKQ
jgi:segregation and condensation protein B